MTAPWITLAALVALGLIYVIMPILTGVFARYRRRGLVRCPETGLMAAVQIDAAHAVATALPGPPELRVTGCTLWPERAGCAQRCTVRV
jgi:hypothetical protein